MIKFCVLPSPKKMGEMDQSDWNCCDAAAWEKLHWFLEVQTLWPREAGASEAFGNQHIIQIIYWSCLSSFISAANWWVWPSTKPGFLSRSESSRRNAFSKKHWKIPFAARHRVNCRAGWCSATQISNAIIQESTDDANAVANDITACLRPTLPSRTQSSRPHCLALHTTSRNTFDRDHSGTWISIKSNGNLGFSHITAARSFKGTTVLRSPNTDFVSMWRVGEQRRHYNQSGWLLMTWTMCENSVSSLCLLRIWNYLAHKALSLKTQENK